MTLPSHLAERLAMPAMVAPMFLVSGAQLAIESCKAGLVGSLTRNNFRTDEEWRSELGAVRDALARLRDEGGVVGPLAANVSIGMPVEPRDTAIAACKDFGVDIVVTAGGDPQAVIGAVHDWGGLLFHDVTSVKFAEKAIAAGVDGLIAIGAGGGGHSGVLSHLAFVPYLRSMFDGVIVMAGAIANGAGVRAAEVLGADLAYLGTRFIATQESLAPDEYKALIVSQTPADLVYTGAISGVPAMWMLESMRRLGLDPNNLPQPLQQAGGYKTAHLPEHVKPWKNLWSAGQGVGLIEDIPTAAELIARLKVEYQSAAGIPPFRDATAGGGHG